MSKFRNTPLSSGTMGVFVIPKGIVVGPLNYVESNDHLKILIGCLWGKGDQEWRLVALQSFWSLKKGPFQTS